MFAHLESKQTRQPRTNRGPLVSPSESVSFAYCGTNFQLIFWAVQGGLGCSLGGGTHLGRAGRKSDSATPCSQSIFTRWLWVSGRDGLSPGSHSHPPEPGSWSHQPKSVLAAFSWEHALFFFFRLPFGCKRARCSCISFSCFFSNCSLEFSLMGQRSL